MKKLFAVLLAASFLAAPMAASADQHKPGRHVTIEKTITKKKVVERNRWAKGHKLNRAERRHVVNSRDFRRYKLREPRRGEQWVKIDNNFLLVSAAATGLILSIAAAR